LVKVVLGGPTSSWAHRQDQCGEAGLAIVRVPELLYVPAKLVTGGLGLAGGRPRRVLTGRKHRAAYAIWVPTPPDVLITLESDGRQGPIRFIAPTCRPGVYDGLRRGGQHLRGAYSSR